MTDMRAVLTATLLCAVLLSACTTTPAGSGGAPATPAQTAAPVVPAAATPAPVKTPAAPSAMPSDDPYGYGY